MSKIELSLSDLPFPDTTTIERQFLADCIGNPESMADFTSIVDETMFTDEKRLYIWRMIVWMFNNGQLIDLPSITARTGNVYINEILLRNIDAATPFAALQHAMQLRAAAIRRRAYHSAVSLIQEATKPNTDELAIFEAAQKLTLDIQGERPLIAEASMDEVMTEVDKEIQENRESAAEGKQTRIPTGFRLLDNLTYGGWGPGQLIILAARPSIGKTAVMLQMAKSAAANGFPATIFSLEMTRQELGQRLLFSTGRVFPKEITTGRINEDGYAPAKDEISHLPIYVNDESRTLAGILSRMTVAVTQGKCKIAFIDYLGLISIDESGRAPLYQQIAKATRELKLIAKRQKIPVVLLCQLNRDAAKEDGSPQLYHLRDSGSIEQDADVVLMLEQEKSLEEPKVKPKLNIWVRKNRQFLKDIKITVQPNDTYSAFTELQENGLPVHTNLAVEATEEKPDEPYYNNF